MSSKISAAEPNQERVATPLELLFDLTFVTSFSVAASQYAHGLSAGHFGTALAAFGFAGFAICWAWINFSWFASAYDTDDWIYRLITMVQMAGVLILATGLPRMFAAVELGGKLELSTIVLGYVVMRLALVTQWLRAARQNPSRRKTCLAYAGSILLNQAGWIALANSSSTAFQTWCWVVFLVLLEMAGPFCAERRYGQTPWQAHHIVERYGLFAIIALGESVVGSVASISAGINGGGWSIDVALLCIAGTSMTFGMWWVYYVMPSAEILDAHRDRAFAWGYSQMIIVTAIVATGAGLHVAANYVSGESHLSAITTILTMAVPLSLYILGIHGLYAYMVGRFDLLHLWLLLGTGAIVALSIGTASFGISIARCLVILAFAPAVTVLGYEMVGRRHHAQVLASDG